MNLGAKAQVNTLMIQGQVAVWRGYIDATALYDLAIQCK